MEVHLDTLHNHIFTDWVWQGPSQPLQQMALAVMGLGQILSALRRRMRLGHWIFGLRLCSAMM